MRMRILAVAVASAAVLAGATAAAVSMPAKAATAECQAVAAGACGSIDTPAGGYDLDVWKQVAASDTPVKVWPQSTADRAEDWEAVVVPAGLSGYYQGLTDKLTWPTPATAVNLEYAPDGVASGYCLSIITSTEYATTALRPCDAVTAANQTFNQYQTFVRVAAADSDGSYTVYESVLTGYALTVARHDTAGSLVVSAPVGAGGPSVDQLWEPNG